MAGSVMQACGRIVDAETKRWACRRASLFDMEIPSLQQADCGNADCRSGDMGQWMWRYQARMRDLRGGQAFFGPVLLYRLLIPCYSKTGIGVCDIRQRMIPGFQGRKR